MLSIDDRLLILILALALDALIGDPRWLWRRLPHPTVLIGRAVAWLDVNLNGPHAHPDVRARSGVFALALLVVGAASIGYMLTLLFASLPGSVVVEAVFVAVLLAGRSLYDHVRAVAKALKEGGVEGGRKAVRHIVGRNPASLDAYGVGRASIESAAENFSDGVVAPAFWYALLGLPGMLAYKAINTADSMIGHRTPRYAAFGRAAARVDDVVNWIPARLSAGLFIAAAWAVGDDSGRAAEAVREDASRHRSVNAGWPEAAMAGALGLALAGPRTYGDRVIDDAWMNASGRDDATIDDINRALKLYVWAGAIMWLIYALLSLAV